MIIDTAAKAKTFRIVSRLISLVFLISFATILVAMPAYGEFPFDRNFILLCLTTVYIITIAYRFVLSPYYVYVSDEGESLHFKYFTLHPFLIQKYAIEIPKAEFAGYELKRIYLGLCLTIELKRSLKNQSVKYPPIRLSLLTAKQRQKVFEMLKKYTQKS